MNGTGSREPVTRERVIETAHTLLQRYGAQKLTLSDVARELGVSHAALYRYFDNKAALDAAIVEGWIQESIERINQAEAKITDPVERLERILVDMHMVKKRKIAADPEVYKLYLAVLQDNPPVLQDYADRVRLAAARALQDYLGPSDPRIPEAAQVLENAVFRFLHPVHTLEALAEDTEPQLKTVIRAVMRAYQPRSC